MIYQVMVTKSVPNENYEQEMKDYGEYKRWGNGGYNDGISPSKNLSVKVLEVELDEKEFIAMKKAVIEAVE